MAQYNEGYFLTFLPSYILIRIFLICMSFSIKDVISVYFTSAFTSEIKFGMLLLLCCNTILCEGEFWLLVEQLWYVYTYFVRCRTFTIMSYFSGIVICCLCVRNKHHYSKLANRTYSLSSYEIRNFKHAHCVFISKWLLSCFILSCTVTLEPGVVLLK
jgi:hypothetical protein